MAVFWGLSEDPCPVTRPFQWVRSQSGPHSPYPLPVERCKVPAQEGGGGGLGTATVLSHFQSLSVRVSPFLKEETLSHFRFLCLVRCPLPFFCSFSLLRFDVWNTFSGANFCFWVSMVVFCFSMVFCLGFCFGNLVSRSRKCPKKFS